jgi:hypothetical protein
MTLVNLFFIRLESGEKIAEYLSSGLPPAVGAIIDESMAEVGGTFEIINVTERPFAKVRKIFELTVRELSQHQKDGTSRFYSM